MPESLKFALEILQKILLLPNQVWQDRKSQPQADLRFWLLLLVN